MKNTKNDANAFFILAGFAFVLFLVGSYFFYEAVRGYDNQKVSALLMWFYGLGATVAYLFSFTFTFVMGHVMGRVGEKKEIESAGTSSTSKPISG